MPSAGSPYTDVGPGVKSLVTGVRRSRVNRSEEAHWSDGVVAQSDQEHHGILDGTEDNGGQPIVKYYYQYVADDGDGFAEADGL